MSLILQQQLSTVIDTLYRYLSIELTILINLFIPCIFLYISRSSAYARLVPYVSHTCTLHASSSSAAAAAPAITGMSLCQRSLHRCKRQDETGRGGEGRRGRTETDATTDKHVASFGTEHQARSVNDRGAPYLPRCLPACSIAAFLFLLALPTVNCQRPRPFISAALRQTHAQHTHSQISHPFSWKEFPTASPSLSFIC